jgi:hypothetical protein
MRKYLARARRAATLEMEVPRLTLDLFLRPGHASRTADRDDLLLLVSLTSTTAAFMFLFAVPPTFPTILFGLVLARVAIVLGCTATGERVLEIVYCGEPVTVDATKIRPRMCVPSRGSETSLEDIDSGAISATLFNDALAAKAIVPPRDVRVDCYADDDESGGGFVLIAFAEGKRRGAGITSGWRDALNIAAAGEQDPFDPELVADALEFMAAEVNSVLCSPRGN